MSKRWSEQEAILLERLVDDGKSYTEIADKLERTKPSIIMKAKELKLGAGIERKRRIPTINVNMPSEDLAYMAGFVDGEGTISLNICKYSYRKTHNQICINPTIKVSNTDKLVLDEFKAIFRNGTFSNEKGSMHRWSKRPVYTLQITRLINILTFLKAIYPYLRIKKKHAEIVIQYCQSRLSKPHGTPYNEHELKLVREMEKIQIKGKRKNSVKRMFHKSWR